MKLLSQSLKQEGRSGGKQSVVGFLVPSVFFCLALGWCEFLVELS